MFRLFRWALLFVPTVAASPDLPTRAWTLLLGGMAEKNPANRMHVLEALGTIGKTTRVIRLVESGLSDKDLGVRQTAATTLGEMKSYKSIPKLKEALEDQAPEVVFAAAQALWDLGDYIGRDIFEEILAGERKDSQGMLKGTMRDTRAKLRSPGAMARMGFNQGVGRFLGPFSWGISIAEELRKDGSAAARALSASRLGDDSDPKSLEDLEEALNDKNWAVRAEALKALGKRSQRSALPKIEPLLSDKNDMVRYMAAASIVRLTRPKPSVTSSSDAPRTDPKAAKPTP